MITPIRELFGMQFAFIALAYARSPILGMNSKLQMKLSWLTIARNIVNNHWQKLSIQMDCRNILAGIHWNCNSNGETRVDGTGEKKFNGGRGPVRVVKETFDRGKVKDAA